MPSSEADVGGGGEGGARETNVRHWTSIVGTGQEGDGCSDVPSLVAGDNRAVVVVASGGGGVGDGEAGFFWALVSCPLRLTLMNRRPAQEDAA